MDTLTEKPRTRHEARARGERHYFTGKPCKRGHIGPRHLTGTCVECGKQNTTAWERRNPGKTKERMARYYRADPERFKARFTKYRRRLMGIPEAERPKPTHCENCGKEAVGSKKMHLDHDHATGKFRGWLCGGCNLAFGILGDTVAALERALDYLRRNGSS